MDPQQADEGRRRRERCLGQLMLITVALMVLREARRSGTTQTTTASNTAGSLYMGVLEKDAAALQGNFPGNLTEYVTGSWRVAEAGFRPAFRSNVSANFAFHDLNAADRFGFENTNGTVSLRVATRLQLVRGIQQVVAIMHVSDGGGSAAGTAATPRDLLMKMSGIYFPQVGKLHLVSEATGVFKGISAYKPDTAVVVIEPSRRRLAEAQSPAGAQSPGTAQLDGLGHSVQEEPGIELVGARGDKQQQQAEPGLLQHMHGYAQRFFSMQPWVNADVAAKLQPWSSTDMVTIDSSATAIEDLEAHWEQLQAKQHGRRLQDSASSASSAEEPLGFDRCGVEAILNVGSLKDVDSSGSAPLVQDLGMEGAIFSANCSFTLNTTMQGLRFNRDALDLKTAYYTFFAGVMTLCQFVVVVHHLITASQSDSTRVSLATIGAFALVDAYLCLAHMLASYNMELWFVRFAVVSGAKLILFSIMEMRMLLVTWMARTPNATNLSSTLTKIYVQFYGTAMLGVVAIVVARNHYPLLLLAGTSFWVPQIIHNAQTGTKCGFKRRYIYVMSITHLYLPLYLLSCPNNFVRVLIPYEPPVYVGVMVAAWMAIQVAIMELQGKFGAQFFVPAFMLPPRYNYQRPIEPTATSAARRRVEAARTRLQEVRARFMDWVRSIGQRRGGYARVARNDHRDEEGDVEMGAAGPGAGAGIGGSGGGAAGAAAAIDVEAGGSAAAAAAAAAAAGSVGATATAEAAANPVGEDGERDCVICMCPVNPREDDYMFTPCDHLFHAECLQRWMDVKMECPSCRANLPPA